MQPTEAIPVPKQMQPCCMYKLDSVNCIYCGKPPQTWIRPCPGRMDEFEGWREHYERQVDDN